MREQPGGPAGEPASEQAREPTPAQAPGQTPNLAIALLSLSSFATSASMRVCDALQPRIAGDFGVALGTASAAIVGFSIAYGVCQVAFGSIGERYGKFVVVVWANLFSALWALGCLLAPGFGALLAARVLAGMTAAAIIPLSLAWIGDVVAYGERQPILARFTLGQMFGVAGGQLLGGYAAERADWKLAFAFLALWFIVGTTLLWRTYRAMPQGMRKPAATAGGPGAGGGMGRNLLDTFRRPLVRRVMLTGFLEGAAVYGALAFIALQLHEANGITLTRAGALSMLFGVGGLLYVAGAQRLVARLGERGLCGWGGVLMCAGLCGLGLFPGVAPAPCICATGLGYYMFHNTLQTQSTQMAPGLRAVGVGLFASSFFLGQAAGVSAVGALRPWLGTGPLIAACGAIVALVGLGYASRRS